MTAEPIVVVGVGHDGPRGLGPQARSYLERAEVLAGGKRQLAFFPAFAGTKIVLEGPTRAWIDRLKARPANQRTVVLASGDPLYYGIGRLLLAAFTKEELIFVPQVGSLALAFARLKETWHDACVVSLHGRPQEGLLPALARREPKIAIFTDEANNPAAIARLLCERGLGEDYDLWVCENLGGEGERVTRWAPPEVKADDIAPLNVVILLAKAEERRTDVLPLLGLPESAFEHRGELITKRGVRLQALSLLELHEGDVLWDVGAGSGSVSIEAGRLSSALTVYAIEKDVASRLHLRHNLERFELPNIHLTAAEAPECLADLPDPAAIFVGGSGGKLLSILDEALRRLHAGGRLVVSCVTFETLTAAWNWLSERQYQPQVTSIQLAHSQPLGSLHCLEPEKPIFLVWVKKP
jgi:precorrin-6Y C5,15-methyltransferase (decarboxylating)